MKSSVLLALLIICAASPAILAQDAADGIVVVKFSWYKERIRPIPSLAPLASQDELIQQSRREQQLNAARNSANKPGATRAETQISNHQKATIKAAQPKEEPRDGYRYKVTLRNDGSKVIKSIDWDYLFFNPMTQEILARHQFTSDETIKPGKTKEISVLYLVPPVKTVDVRLLRKKEEASITELVVVARLLFTDGSIWQHP